MKDCPRCGLANPPTAKVCDCGYSFQTGTAKLVCPNCHASEGLRSLARDGGVRIAALLLGGLAGSALSRSQTNQVHCQECGHTFRPFSGVGSRPPALWEWLFCIAILSAGVCLVGVYVFGSHFGVT